MFQRCVRWLKRLLGVKHKEREWYVWIGDEQCHTTPADLVGKPVDFHGRKGVCVDKTDLYILVEWED